MKKYAIWSCYEPSPALAIANDPPALNPTHTLTANGYEGWDSRWFQDNMLYKDMRVVYHEDINAAYRWINKEENLRPRLGSQLPLFFEVREYED